MASKFTEFGVGIFGIILIMLWAIIQVWYIVLPIIAVAVIFYFYNQHKKEVKRKQQIQQQIEAQRQRIIRENEGRKRRDEEQRRREQQKREEKIRREKERKERLEREKQQRVKTRLELFAITEEEAALIFGRNWRGRLEKPDKEFFTKELGRICEKLTDSFSYKIKIAHIMEKVFDLIDKAMHIMGRMQGWDDFDFENWDDNWDDVWAAWKKEKSRFQGKSSHQRKRSYSYEWQDDSDSKNESYWYKILGISKNSTVQEIKIQYRKLMMKFHPDKNKSPDAEKRSKEIIEAYSEIMKMEER